jgi:hypothetical protein
MSRSAQRQITAAGRRTPIRPSTVGVDVTEETSPPRVFADADYCYGVGPLTLRVQRIDWANPVKYDNDTWYHVDGVELTRSGNELGRRRVLVRGRQLPAPDRPGTTAIGGDSAP